MLFALAAVWNTRGTRTATDRDGGRARHVVHERQLAEAALVVVAADLLGLGAVVHLHVNAVLAAVNRTNGWRHTQPEAHGTSCASSNGRGLQCQSQ